MNKYIVSLFVVWVLLLPLGLQAQTAKWVIAPKYSSIVFYGKGLYKVKTGRHVGILDDKGNVIVPVNADSITAMTEACALVLQYEEEKYRLKGILHEDHRFVVISDEWYVGDFPFFSEGKLPVYNKSGKYGYVGTNGALLIDFEYGNVHPFSEGWAAVSQGKNLLSLIKKKSKQKVFYIDGQGRTMTIQSDIGDIYSGTTFKNGEALVITKDNRYCFINTSGQLTRIDNNVMLAFDERYALQTEAEAPQEKPSQTVFYDGPTTFSENDLYGYKQAGKIMLPPQFDEATPFFQGFAIASVNGEYGLLKLVDGNFSCVTATGSLKTSEKGMRSVDYVVSVPKEWENSALELTCVTDGKDKTSSLQPGTAGPKRTFSFIIPQGNQELSLSGEGLTVWNTSMGTLGNTYGELSEDISISIHPSTVKANARDNAPVTVILKNNTAAALEFTVTVTGKQLKTVNRKVKLASGQSQKISTYFMKVKKADSRTVSVATSLSSNTVSKRIQLVPFFVKY
ncbi:WG repeat-containing protein [Phocaeicola barnesiae]